MKYAYIAYFGKSEVIVNEQKKPLRTAENIMNHGFDRWSESCKTIQIAQGHSDKFINYCFTRFNESLESGIQHG